MKKMAAVDQRSTVTNSRSLSSLSLAAVWTLKASSRILSLHHPSIPTLIDGQGMTERWEGWWEEKVMAEADANNKYQRDHHPPQPSSVHHHSLDLRHPA